MSKKQLKNNHIKNLMSLLLLGLMYMSLTSCVVKYPITAYDNDLKESQRKSIAEAYDNKLIEKEEKKNTKNNATSKDNSEIVKEEVEIAKDYIEYENNIVRTDKVESNFPVVVLFKNQPDFDLKKYSANTFEKYSELDSLGRVGKAEAMLGKETMPTTARESIGMIKPTGWHIAKYDNVDGKYLFNRCHLIGWQLSAENANEKNLFTGTRYLNTEGMLPFENKVANYIKSTGNHVLYRVTPYFSGNNLVASHVQIEAMSYEDNGAGICINVKLENIQPGIHIDYATGESYSEVNETQNNNV